MSPYSHDFASDVDDSSQCNARKVDGDRLQVGVHIRDERFVSAVLATNSVGAEKRKAAAPVHGVAHDILLR